MPLRRVTILLALAGVSAWQATSDKVVSQLDSLAHALDDKINSFERGDPGEKCKNSNCKKEDCPTYAELKECCKLNPAANLRKSWIQCIQDANPYVEQKAVCNKNGKISYQDTVDSFLCKA